MAARFIDRHERGVFLIRQECQPRRQNLSEPGQIQRKTAKKGAFNSTRIRLNYEPDAAGGN